MIPAVYVMELLDAAGNFNAMNPAGGTTIRSSGIGTYNHPFNTLNTSLISTVLSVPSAVASVPVAAVPPTASAGEPPVRAAGVAEVTVAAALLRLI